MPRGGNGYQSPEGSGPSSRIVKDIKEVQKRVEAVERPDGTSIGRLVEQVQAALTTVDARVATSIAAQSYTKAQIDNLVANPPAGSAVTGNSSATGNVSAGGSVNAGTDVTAGGNITASGQVISTGIVRSPGSRAYNVVAAGGYVGTWQDVNGNFGFNPSGVEFKQDFEPAQVDQVVDAVLRLGLLRYRYIGESKRLGKLSPLKLGTIAQYMATGPLAEWVTETEAGAVINWEQFAVPLVATVQHLDGRIKQLEKELADIKLFLKIK